MNENNTFNPREHLISIKNRQSSSEYLPVQWRLVWFRQECPEGTIETEMVHFDLDKETEEEIFVWNAERRRSEKVIKTARGVAIFRAIVRDGKGGVATGTKMEKAASFPDFLEKAETGAIGRALAALGYGTQFAPELNEEHRIVDSPVNRSAYTGNGHDGELATQRANELRSSSPHDIANQEVPAQEAASASVTDQQISSIRKLCQHLGKSEPENVTSISYLSAKKMIQQLTAEYKEQRQNSKAS